MKKATFLILLLAIPGLSYAQSWPPSFDTVKKRAESDVYFDRLTTFYCKCDYVFDDVDDIDGDGNVTETMVMPETCGYEPRVPVTRSGNINARISRIEWEHIMPASSFGGELDEWKNHRNYDECKKSNGKSIGGRKCAEKLVPWFKKAHNDMHNLTPAVGELNGDRSNFPYAEIEGESRIYGACDFEVNFEARVTEPPHHVKGDIARTYLYMSREYNIHLDRTTLIQMLYWDRLDPVDDWECERDKRIMSAQGNTNPLVSNLCE